MVSLLDIIGPVMVGPSSSHTAGACRIGLFARGLVGGTPAHARVELHGSFAETGTGHGTDRAIAGGLLGFLPDDDRLRESLELARQAGLELDWHKVRLRGDHHPNTARLTVTRGDQTSVVTGSSLGAGRVLITQLDGFPVEITGSLDTLVIVARDQPGTVASVTAVLAREGVNLATMRVSRRQKGGDAVHIYELDHRPAPEVMTAIRALPAIRFARAVERIS